MEQDSNSLVDPVDSPRSQAFVWPASGQPLSGQVSGDEDSVIVRLLIHLEFSVRLIRTPPASDEDFRQFEKDLLQVTSQREFIQFTVAPDGIYSGGKLLAPAERLSGLHNLLRVGGVAEIIFKKGLETGELQRFVYVLKLGRWLTQDPHRFAACLWEVDAMHVVIRFTDEPLLPDSFFSKAFVRVNEPLESQGLASWIPREKEVRAAMMDTKNIPQAEHEGSLDALSQVLEWTAADQEVCRSLRVSDASTDLQAIVSHLVESWKANTSPDSRGATRKLLETLVHTLLSQQQWSSLRDVFLWLNKQEAQHKDKDLRGLIASLSEQVTVEPFVLQIGKQLSPESKAKKEVKVLGELLRALDSNVVDNLCAHLNTLEDMDARKYVCRVLAVVGAHMPGSLARRVLDQPWYVLRNMAHVLGRIGGSQVIPHLRQWVRHEDPRVRTEVVRALGRVDHSGARQILMETLSDSEERIRQAAVWALGLRRDPAILQHLHRLIVKDKRIRSRSQLERDDLFRAYGRLVKEEDLKELVEWISYKAILESGWKTELRRGAAIALGETDFPDAVLVLQKIVTTRNKRLREACERALAEIQNRKDMHPMTFEEAAFEPFKSTPSMVDLQVQMVPEAVRSDG